MCLEKRHSQNSYNVIDKLYIVLSNVIHLKMGQVVPFKKKKNYLFVCARLCQLIHSILPLKNRPEDVQQSD